MQVKSSAKKIINHAYKLINAGYDISDFDKYIEDRSKFSGRNVSLSIAAKSKISIDSRFGNYQEFYNAYLFFLNIVL